MTALFDAPQDSGRFQAVPDGEDSGEALHADSYADMVEKLFSEYETKLSLCAIVDIVQRCRHDLAGSPAGALPELTERLARQRIEAMVSGQAG
jgi:hypothetical protein